MFKIKKQKILIFSFIYFFNVFPAFAADYNKDLLLNPESVYFSKETPIVDTQLRIYAKVTNLSQYDLAGTVKFYDEKMQIPIGVDQPISVLAGKTDDVFIDFQIKGYGDHPIAVKVIAWEKEGDNPENNKITKNIFVDYDTDHDGIPNRLDSDDDNDGCLDDNDDLPFDASDCKDTDGDKVGNKLDPDDDNDDLLDLEEAEKGTDPLLYDTDGDGVNDKLDVYPLDPKRAHDFDQDGLIDEDDPDDDNDGYLDKDDSFPFDASECLDTDQDGLGNNIDPDDDNDGLSDTDENTLTKTNPLLYDTDGDGINDKDDLFPLDPNEQKDTDNDGLGDNADPNDANFGPMPVIYSSTLITRVGEVVEFDASASLDQDGSIARYQWDFGDGSPILEDRNVTHIFQAAGVYEIKLTLTDDQGESREKIVTMIVQRSYLLAYFLISFGLILIFVIALKKLLDKENQR